MAADSIEQGEHACDVGADEGAGVDEGAVDVRLGGDVDDGVGLGDEGVDEVRIGDVTADEPVAGIVQDAVEVGKGAGIGQQVERHDHVLRVACEDVTNVGAADESGTAGDENAHRASPPTGWSERPVSPSSAASRGT